MNPFNVSSSQPHVGGLIVDYTILNLKSGRTPLEPEAQ